MKFGLCNEIYYDRTIFEAIKHAASIGYHGLELAPFTLTDDITTFPVNKQKEIAQCASDNGIEILGLHWLLLKPEGLHITTPDKTVRNKTLDVFKKLIEVNKNTGGRILTLGSPKQRSFDETCDTKESATNRAIEFFQELTDELESAGSVLALEPLETELTNFMTGTEETCHIIDAVGSKMIGITLDTHFLRWASEESNLSINDNFEIAGKRLVHLHIQDDNRNAPGTGSADFTEYIAAVNNIGWNDYISMETKKQKDSPELIAENGIIFMEKKLLSTGTIRLQ
jgi:sugar phosphate isomerase/epimerase